MSTQSYSHIVRKGTAPAALGTLLAVGRLCSAATSDPCEHLRPNLSGDDNTLLTSAIAAADHACVDWLLKNSDLLKAANAQGRTKLHEAAARADVELVKKLLAAGQEASQPDAAGETPLMLLAGTPFELPPESPCAVTTSVFELTSTDLARVARAQSVVGPVEAAFGQVEPAEEHLEVAPAAARVAVDHHEFLVVAPAAAFARGGAPEQVAGTLVEAEPDALGN